MAKQPSKRQAQASSVSDADVAAIQADVAARGTVALEQDPSTDPTQAPQAPSTTQEQANVSTDPTQEQDPTQAPSPMAQAMAAKLDAMTPEQAQANDAVNDAAEAAEQAQDGAQDGAQAPDSTDGAQAPQDGAQEQEQADPFATAVAALMTATEATLPAADTGTVPTAHGDHAVACVRVLRGKRRADAQAEAARQASAQVKLTRDPAWIDAVDHVNAYVTDKLDAGTASTVMVDPTQHAADVLATLDAIRVLTLGALTAEQATAVTAKLDAGQATADITVLGLRGKRAQAPSKPRDPNAPKQEKAPAGSVAANIVTYLRKHAADGHGVKHGEIARAMGHSAGAVARSANAGIPGVISTTVRDGDRDIAAVALLTSTGAQEQELREIEARTAEQATA